MQQQLEQACLERLDSYLQEAAHTLLGRMKDRYVLCLEFFQAHGLPALTAHVLAIMLVLVHLSM